MSVSISHTQVPSITNQQITDRTLPRSTMVFDIKHQCVKHSSSYPDLSVINQVVLENGQSEPVAKHGSPMVDVDNLLLPINECQSLHLQVTRQVKPKLLLERSNSLSVLVAIINDRQRCTRSSKNHILVLSVVLPPVPLSTVPADQPTLLSITTDTQVNNISLTHLDIITSQFNTMLPTPTPNLIQ
jgi:hypothetical protein